MSNSDTQPAHAFSTLKLEPELLDILSSMVYHAMTPIQARSLPAILAGEDVIGQGKTCSGTTAALGLGLLNQFDVKRLRIHTLVLCPTPALAAQAAQQIRTLARGTHHVTVPTLSSRVPILPQLRSLAHRAPMSVIS
ncbi:DEAD/DEAH box helicase, partial [Plesiomonas shigelloides]